MNSVWAGIIRHALTALGGGLVATGNISEGDLQSVIGAIITIGGVVASYLKNRNDSNMVKR